MSDRDQRIRQLESQVSDLREGLHSLQRQVEELNAQVLRGQTGSDRSFEKAHAELADDIQRLVSEIERINGEDPAEKPTSPAPIGVYIISTILIFVVLAVITAILSAAGIIDDPDTSYRYDLIAAVLLGTVITIMDILGLKKTPAYATDKKAIISLVMTMLVSIAISAWLIHDLVQEFDFYHESHDHYYFYLPTVLAVFLLFIIYRNWTELREQGNSNR